MRRLRVITPEEQRILDGGAVDKAAYTARAVFTVDSEKLLERGRLISVRAHTRFAPFPRHAHSYIEIMYMCSGKTVHRINGGEPITVHAGELLFLGRGASHEIERAEYEDIAVNFIVLPQFFDTALERIGELWVRLHGFGGGVKIDWEDINLQDIVEEAKAELYRAQAEKIRLGDRKT